MLNERQLQRAIIASEWREGWSTGVATILGMGLGAAVMPTVFSLFVRPLGEAFGWTPGQIGLAQNAALLSAIASPFAGRLIDRMGARPFILCGLAGLATAYLALAAMPGRLALFYTLWTAATVVGVATSGLGFSQVMGLVFPKSLGFSLAVGRTGQALAGIALPPALYAAIDAYGWRAGYVLMAALILLLALPAVWQWLERSAPKAPEPRTFRESHRRPWASLLSDRRIVIVALAAALAYAALIAIVSQLQPLLISKGIAPASAAAMMGLIGASSFAGALVTGLLLDRLWAPGVALAMMLAAASGAALLLWHGGNPRYAAAGLFLLGLGQGAEFDIVGFVVARYFGMRNFGGLFGLVVFSIAVGVAVGSSLIGLSFDAFHSYDPGLGVAAGALVLSGLAYLLLGRYPDRPDG
ncbi:MFS transporter [uncultured Sphingomonas sp.]|uniref:MFS transporter n=1 Tax=uncultured Sphingomonas sp. TaxID=158754 RepID=UPI0025E98FE7|nr:MFS transporter [uncultured Sphingomonas sp.]